MQTAVAVSAAVAAAPTEAVEAERDGGRYVTVWVLREEEQPVPAPTAGSEGTLRFVDRVSVAVKLNSGKGMVNLEPHRYDCSIPMVIQGAAKGPCVLPAMLAMAQTLP